MRLVTALLAGFGVVVASAGPAHAGSSEGPGIYGELDGALTVGLAGGLGFAAGGAGGGAGALALGQIDLLVLSTAGVKLGYQTYGRDLAAGASFRQHDLTIGLDLRPLFWTLFLTNAFTGKETLDLFLYSIGLEIGASWERTTFAGPVSGTDSTWGFHLGLGMEVPLVRRGGQGLYLRLQLRGSFARDLALPPGLASVVGRSAHAPDGVQVALLLRYRFQFWSRP